MESKTAANKIPARKWNVKIGDVCVRVNACTEQDALKFARVYLDKKRRVVKRQAEKGFSVFTINVHGVDRKFRAHSFDEAKQQAMQPARKLRK